MITHSPTALAGSVTTLNSYRPADFSPTSAILCRNTAPLVALAFGLIRRGVGCRVLGRDFGLNLISVVESVRAADIHGLIQGLQVLSEKELKRARLKGNPQLCAAIEDKFNCLVLFTQNATTVADVIDKLNRLFDDKSQGLLTLSTIHKAKGLEWTKVFLLDRELMPSKFARSDWEKRQESNLMYVAVTRAKLDLVYIKSNCWLELMASFNEQADTDEREDDLF